MFERGMIVLVPFPFTNLSANKVRPAVILSNNLTGDDVIVAFISSQAKRAISPTEIPVKAKGFTGLKQDSIIKIAKLATLEKKIVLGELGKLDSATLDMVGKKLKVVFGL